jgi:hypothetical protein
MRGARKRFLTGRAAEPAPVLRQPSFAELAQLAPGGVDASASAGPANGAPLLCGDSYPGQLAEATIVKIPNHLHQISVLHYLFADVSAASGYLNALRADSSKIQPGSCRVTTADSSRLVQFYLFDSVRSTILTTEYRKYSSGLYASAEVNSAVDYVMQRTNAYVVRIDRQHGGLDIELEDAVMNLVGAKGVFLSPSPRPAPSHLVGVLMRAPFVNHAHSDLQGTWSYQEDNLCPEVVSNGVAYSVVIERQLPNAQPAGLVVLADSEVTTIPWGARVTVSVDFFHKQSDQPFEGCGTTIDPEPVIANAVAITASST